jgi:hypothetical protein
LCTIRNVSCITDEAGLPCVDVRMRGSRLDG